ncbi:MAG: ABC transporter substrate-binding protein [Candidatus Heimdallarchaeota archaeon]
MKKKIHAKIIVCMIIVIFSANVFLFATSYNVSANGYYLSLRTLVLGSGSTRIDYANFMKQQLARIGIDLNIHFMHWADWAVNPVSFSSYDINMIALTGGDTVSNIASIYQENSYFNFAGYRTDMDWDESLGTGKNEWYITHGKQIMPPNSEERIQHYHEWQNYMMDELLLVQPMFTKKHFEQSWSTLNGYNSCNGILQSWGKMSWNSLHPGQINTSEVVISDAAWSDLNPLFQDDDSSEFLSDAIQDPLFWKDYDRTYQPHLATNFEMINDTHVRIHLREGIKWQTDPDGHFTNEYFDVEDVYFTLFAWNELSNDQQLFDWLEDMKIIDKYTIDLFIDEDPNTPENKPYSEFLERITVNILPEHYLNQTLDYRGYPDVTHASWNTFATNCFGTGLFQLDEFDKWSATILTVNPDSWWLNNSIANDPNLDWENRFGDFSGGLTQLRVRIIPDSNIEREFEIGSIDISPISNSKPLSDDNFSIQHTTPNFIFMLMYNVLPIRYFFGSTEPCSNDPSITKGLAIRKAVSYALDRDEINSVVHGGNMKVTDYPIYEALGIWCNPNIIRYNHDLEMAKYYMELAGYAEPLIMGFEFADWLCFSFIISIFILTFKRKQRMRK